MSHNEYEVEFTVRARDESGEMKMLGCGCGCSLNGSVSVTNTRIVDINLEGGEIQVMQSSVDKYLKTKKKKNKRRN